MRGKQGRRAGLLFSQLLALVFLSGCLWWTYREFALSFTNHPVLPSLTVQEHLGSTLGRQLAWFGVAAWLVHALLGFAAFGLATLTSWALPRTLRVRQGLLVAGWFVLLVGIAFAANSAIHPTSLFAGDGWRQPARLGLAPATWLVLATVLLVIWLAWRAWPRVRGHSRQIALAAAVIAIPLLLLPLPHIPKVAAAPSDARPHVVIIGIDSLRDDLSLPGHGTASAPAIRAFLGSARQFSDVTSPLPRTYGAWVSILTGRHPVNTNARVNLMPRNLVREGRTLPESLRAGGYGTIYATDESRFANIDESFGFEQTVTPPIGAADFLLGYAGDMPLVNLVSASPAGRLLFPSNHANRGAYVTYRPGQFLDRLDREITIDRPTFMVIHLTLAHWPYAWAGTPVPTQPGQYRAAYAAAVDEVDRQFGSLMNLLEKKGVLDDAIVVLLSDHGEALGGEHDSMLRGTGSSREIWDSLWGHGTSVLSPSQYEVLFAMRAFGRARLPGPDRGNDWPVTLEDLRPTLEELATGIAPVATDGISLVPFMAEPGLAASLDSRVRFTETDFNTPRTLAGDYEVSGIVDEAAVFYEVDGDSGWVQFRADRLPELLAAKQRASFSPANLLAAIPQPSGAVPRYLYTSRRDPHPTVMEGPADAWPDPEARRLWKALAARFPGELRADPGVPRM